MDHFDSEYNLESNRDIVGKLVAPKNHRLIGFVVIHEFSIRNGSPATLGALL